MRGNVREGWWLVLASLVLVLGTGCPEDPDVGGGSGDTGSGDDTSVPVDAEDVVDQDGDDQDSGEPTDSSSPDDASEDAGELPDADQPDGEASDGGPADASDTQAADTQTADTTEPTDTATPPDTATADTAGPTDAAQGQCGGIAGLTCDKDEWCDYPKYSCGIADRLGTCRKKPAVCNKKYDPVCGCDGKTYGNLCMAKMAGIDIASTGACNTGSSCGGTKCTSKEYCDYTAMQCSGAGTCKPRPRACPRIYKPVCGCDGKTYSNDCVARSNGVSVASTGKCSP